MIVQAPALHLILVMSMATPAPPDPSACAANDLRCTGHANAEAARLAETSEQRVNHLYRAHRAYLALANKGPEPQRVQDLCRAHELIQQARELPPTAIDARVVDSDQKTQARLAAEGVECRGGKRVRRGAPRRVALAAAPAPVQDTKPPRATDPADPPPLSPAQSEAASAEATRATTPTDETSPVATRAATTPTDEVSPAAPRTDPTPRLMSAQPRQEQAPPSGRRLLVAGSVTLGAGLALSIGAGVMGSRLLGKWREGQALLDGTDPYATLDEFVREGDIRDEYQQLRPPTLALAFASGAALVVGAVLVAVGARRLGRVTSRAAVLPMPGGLAFRARF